MAYMSFTPWEADSATTARPASLPAGDVALFSPLELRVINLGTRSDVSREWTAGSRAGRILERIFGLKLDHPLASSRLERLRRYASLVRHHPDQVSEADMGELIEVGFSRGQVYGLLNHLKAGPRAAPSAPDRRHSGKIIMHHHPSRQSPPLRRNSFRPALGPAQGRLCCAGRSSPSSPSG